MFVADIVAICSPLERPPNGSANASTAVSVLGDVDRPAVTLFTCDLGFELTGPSNRKCLANGTWSGYQPDCQC